MLAGPSEVLVIADSTANVETVAADLLAQVNTPKSPENKETTALALKPGPEIVATRA